RLKPRRSDQRRYIRSSISAQSWDSVPPAPGWMATIAFRRSCTPPSIFLIERVERLTEFAVHGFAGLRPFDQYREVVALLPKRFDQVAILLQPFPALEDFLRFPL